MLPCRERLGALDVVLASGSPRRRELLEDQLQLIVDVVPSTFEEDLGLTSFCAGLLYLAHLADKDDVAPAAYCAATAFEKAKEVESRLGRVPDLIIACDSIVVHNGVILEKPRDADHAKEMLRALSGDRNEVISALCLIFPRVPQEERIVQVHRRTVIEFCEMTSADIDAYVASGEPLDKAGAYGVQGLGGCYISHMEGCFYNAMGLPLYDFCREVSARVPAMCAAREK